MHYLDETLDWKKYQDNGIYKYILKLKEKKVIRHIGLSSHTSSVIEKIINDVTIDILMFSVNQAYDYGHGDFANGRVNKFILTICLQNLCLP